MAGYNIVPQSLKNAANVFAEQGRRTEVAHETFAAAAHLTDEVFGNLPSSWQMANQYQAFFTQVQNDLANLQRSLVGTGDRLESTEQAYRKAEESNTLWRRHHRR